MLAGGRLGELVGYDGFTQDTFTRMLDCERIINKISDELTEENREL